MINIPPIEDPQQSTNLCSKKLYQIIMFKYPLLNPHNIHIICVLKNCITLLCSNTPIQDPQQSYYLCSQKLSTTVLCSDVPIQDPQH